MPKTKPKQPPALDVSAELATMHAMYDNLANLSPAARERVLTWLRHALKWPASSGLSGPGDPWSEEPPF